MEDFLISKKILDNSKVVKIKDELKKEITLAWNIADKESSIQPTLDCEVNDVYSLIFF